MTAHQADHLVQQAIDAARAGQREAARQHLLAALQVAPDHPRAARLLARLNQPDVPTPQRPQSRRWLWLLALAGVTGLVVVMGLLVMTSTPSEQPLPTEFVLATATTGADVLILPDDLPSQVLAVPTRSLPTETTDELIPTDVTDALVEDSVALPTNTPIQFSFVLPTLAPAETGSVTVPPLFASATAITFNPVIPLPTNTQVPFVFAQPTATRPSSTATPPSDTFVPLPTSTVIPEFVFGTEVPPLNLPTSLPPTDTAFEVDPLGGGGAPRR